MIDACSGAGGQTMAALRQQIAGYLQGLFARKALSKDDTTALRQVRTQPTCRTYVLGLVQCLLTRVPCDCVPLDL